MNEYVNYKKYVTRQESLHEAEFAAFPKKDEYTGVDSLEPKVSPTARPTPIIGIAIRGSSTGGLPSGADQQGDISPTKVGGYDRVQPKNLNSTLVDKTPTNAEIKQDSIPINNHPSTSGGVTHPHQIQVTAHEEPQAVTGASTDSDPTLKLKSASPKGIDVDIDGPEGESETDTMQNKPENQMIPATSLSEGKHKAGCKCGFCMNRGKFGKKNESETPEPKLTQETEKEKKDNKALDETFKRHMVLMKEYMAKKCPCGCEPDKCNCPENCPKCSCNKDEPVKECATCGCGDPTDDHFEDESKDKKPLKESYAPPFSRMRSFAGIGDTVLLSNGLMETAQDHSNKIVGADHPFTTHWKMDKQKAGYVKVDEEKLKQVKSMLERKSKRGSLSETEYKLAKRLEEVLKRRQAKS